MSMPKFSPETGPGHEAAQSEQEVQATAEQVEQVIFPTWGNDALDRIIDARVFAGATNDEERKAKLQEAGWGPEDLEEIGRDILTEFEKFKNDERAYVDDGSPGPLRAWFWGLGALDAKPREGSKRAPRTPFEIGLRGELSRMSRKLLFSSLRKTEEDQDETFFLHADVLRDGRFYPKGDEEVPNFSPYVRDFVRMQHTDPGTLNSRIEGILSRIDGDDIRHRYRFVAGLLSKEATIASNKQNT